MYVYNLHFWLFFFIIHARSLTECFTKSDMSQLQPFSTELLVIIMVVPNFT